MLINKYLCYVYELRDILIYTWLLERLFLDIIITVLYKVHFDFLF